MNAPEGFVIDDDIQPPEGFQVDESPSLLRKADNAIGKAAGWVDRVLPAAVKDVEDQAVNLAKAVPTIAGASVRSALPGSGLLMKGPNLTDLAMGAVKGTIDEGKRIGAGELLSGNPGAAASKFGEAWMEKPVTTTLDVLPAVGAAGRALGIGRAARGAELAGAASKSGVLNDAARAGGAMDDFSRVAAGAPSPISIGDEAARILKEPPATTPGPATGAAADSIPTGATFQETVANLGKRIPEDVKAPLKQVESFVSEKYGKAAAQPGFKDVIGDAMIRKAQGMRFRELGGTPGQARILVQKLGEDGLRELMDIAKDRGITRSPVGFQRRKATQALQQSSGQAIGGIRKLAAKRGAVHNPKDLVKQIRANLDAEYLGKGIASGEKGTYMKALKDIEAAATTPDALARKITELNKRVTKNKMTQPTSAITDVVNEASRINNELIRKHLSQKEIGFYDQALGDFGAAKIFDRLQGFEVGREFGGRAGVGGLFRNLKQGAMDIGGSKVMENFYDKFGPRLKTNPNATKNLYTLGEGAMDDLLSALDDAINEIAPPK